MIGNPSLIVILAGAYFLSGVLYTWRIVRRSEAAGRVATAVGLVGVALHGALIVMRSFDGAHAPAATVSDAASLVSFLTAAGFLAGQHIFGLRAIGAVAMPLCLGGVVVAAVYPSDGVIDERLQSIWFFLHVPPVLLAYVAFGYACTAAALYLGQTRLLRSKRIQAVIGVLPSLDELENAMYRTAAFGFLLLTIGMATGAAWANQAFDGGWWEWSPKQTGSLVTWLLFAMYLHLRVVRGSRSRAGAWVVIVGFVSVVATFLLVGMLPNFDPHRFI